MIIVMEPGAEKELYEAVCERVAELGYQTHPIIGVERTVIGCVGHEDKTPLQALATMPGVEAVIPILKPYKLVGRELKKEKSVVDVAGVKIGGPTLVVMAGPCSVENREQVMETAQAVKQSGAQILRGGAYKPRTSPYDFQGMEEEGLKLLALAREETGLPFVTEVMNPRELDLVRGA